MLNEIGGKIMEPDFILYVAGQLVFIGVVWGIMTTKLKYIEKSMERLEKKQDKHNGLVSRMFVAEEKIGNIIDKVGDHIEDGKSNKGNNNNN